jgi:Zn-dependent protease with chaperone function
MATSNPFRKDLAKIVLLTLLSFFLLPGLTYLFVKHAQGLVNERYVIAIERSVDKNPSASSADKEQFKAFLRANPPSTACGNNSGDIATYRENVCPEYSELWQFHWAGKISVWTMIAGVAILLIVLGMGGMAFINRRMQYLSFIAGWRLLSMTSAAEVVLQGSMAVWLSFWVTAVYFERYSLKLIAVIGFAAAAAAFFAVASIFKRPPQDNSVEGELVSESDSPRLWQITRALAEKLKTAPPDQIIAGIDTNFFVTEAPLTVNGKPVSGRSLFVSIPLLRVLDSHEAGAVLAHELAHLRGGDTASSAELGPRLVQFDQYAYVMKSSVLTLPVYYLLCLYRVIFEVALKSDSRAREFLADRIASKMVSPAAIVQSLVKIAAYAKYRAQVEQRLFEQQHQHSGNLGIAGFVESGLAPYATSTAFLDDMQTADIPHPFDSHPSLQERMKNVGHELDVDDYSGIVTARSGRNWAEDIQTAADIEHRLWTAYEQRFAAAHEQALAYRYEPSGEAETAIVLKYFPPVKFELKKNLELLITHAGMVVPGTTDMMSWDSVAELKYEDGYGGDVLEIVHTEKKWLGSKTTKVKLPGIKPQRDSLKAVLGHYLQRHRIMRQQVPAQA